MSNKPLKKSDCNKQWMQKRNSIPSRTIKEYHLIIYEGEKTEPNYFNAIKEKINTKYKNMINLEIYGEGNNTVQLFYDAKKVINNKMSTQFDHVWLIYDVDDFKIEDVNKVQELCNTENKKKKKESHAINYHAIWSNQCIEVWFLLHFEYMQSNIHRNEYGDKISKKLVKLGLGSYAKNRKDIFNILRPYLNNAIENSKKLDNVNKNKTPAASTPGTKMYEIMEYLQVYLV